MLPCVMVLVGQSFDGPGHVTTNKGRVTRCAKVWSPHVSVSHS